MCVRVRPHTSVLSGAQTQFYTDKVKFSFVKCSAPTDTHAAADIRG